MNRRIEQGQQTRRELLRVATRLFAEQGYAETSIEQVLAQSPVSRGSLYYHFKSKEELFEAVLEDVEARVARRLAKAAASERDPFAALRVGCHEFLRAARTPEVRRIVLTDAPSVVGWERWREIDRRHAFGIMRGALQAIAPDGRGGASTELLAHVLLAALLELATIVAQAGKPRAATAEAQGAIDELLERLLR
jgi:AcrR family transcriptional regulator